MIRDSNVVSIKYSGKRVKRFLLVNVPLLAAVLPQLQMLKMCYMHKGLSWKESRKFSSAVQMCNLKQLVRFVLEVPVPHTSNGNENDEFFARALARARKKIRDEYPHLREIEFAGYRGVDSQFEVIKHFVESGVALENIVVDPRGFECSVYHPWDRISPRTIFHGELLARAYAKDQLQQ
ncbi:hypothetical protein C2S51_010351 [Perilla frutescens var. frutescens]|nr:hypothetical protein C2S51_010351 [Perilla frutescens var. frutescens]